MHEMRQEVDWFGGRVNRPSPGASLARGALSRTRERGALELAALFLAAGDFGVEGFELVLPEPAEVVEPGVDLAQGRRVEGVDAARAVDADVGKARVAQ